MLNHEGKDSSDLTEPMKMDLRFIVKSKRVVDIMEFLEAKYKSQGLSYQKVYYHLRKIKPLFGLRDCAHFTNYLREENFFVESVFQEDNETLCKLFFCKSSYAT